MPVETREVELIRQRKRADISQAEVAEFLGISPRAVAYFEAGERALPRERTRADYLDALTAIKTRKQGAA